MPGPENKWDANAERDLCIAIYMATNERRVTYNWAKTHEYMQSLGHAFTKDSMSQHFTKKIFKDWKNCSENMSSSAPAMPKKAAETPSKRKAPSAKAAKKLAEVKQDDGADNDKDDGDGGELAATPSKKVKLEKQQAPVARARKAKKAKVESSKDADLEEEKFKAWLENED